MKINSQKSSLKWVRELLDKMAERPVKIKRSEARSVRREVFGPAASCDAPRGKHRTILRLPHSDDVLVLDYAELAPRFQPSWVSGRLYRGAVRVVLPPTASPWVQSILRPFQRRAEA